MINRNNNATAQQPEPAKKHKHFTQLPNWFFDNSKLKRGAQNAYNHFYRIYAHTGCRFVGSVYDLQDELNVPKTTLQRYIPQWEAEGLIVKETIIVNGKRGRKKPRMELIIPLDTIWERNDKKGQVVHIRPGNDAVLTQKSCQSDPKNVPFRPKKPAVLTQNERQNSPKRDEGGPFWATNDPKWARMEHESGGNTGNTTTNVVSNTPNTQAIAVCVNQGVFSFLGSLTDMEETLGEAFFSLDEDEEPSNQNLEEKMGDSSPTEFPIANSTIEPVVDQADRVNDYTKSVFPERWTSQECIRWFEQHQGYPFRTNQQQSATLKAEDLLASYTPRQVILTFLFMKYIDPYWADPRKNGLVNLFLVNKLIQTKDDERQHTSWFVESLPTNCREYYEEEMGTAHVSEGDVPAYLRPNTFASPIGEEEKDGQRAPEPEEEREPEEDPTLKREGDRCGYLACSCAPGQIDNTDMLWCEEHSVRGSFMNTGLLYEFPEIAYSAGKVRQGRQGWQEWVRVVTTENFWQAVSAFPTTTTRKELS
jgi:hypothetical protein